MQKCPILWPAASGFGHVFIEIHSNQGACPRRERENLPLSLKSPKNGKMLVTVFANAVSNHYGGVLVSVVIRLVNTVCSA